MTTRSTFMLAAIAALGFALVLLLLHPFGTQAPNVISASAPSVQPNPSVAAEDPARGSSAAAPAKAAATPTPANDEALRDVGQATGTIHFEKKPTERDAKAATIDLKVHAALGVWQPDGLVMRVLLLESRPAATEIGSLLDALQSGQTKVAANRSAMLELRFVPTAQAYDRNELDTATLVVLDGNVTSAADALSSIDWRGSLPSPNVASASDQRPTFTLNSSNETVTAARETWQQSWHLALTVPVITRASQP